MSKGHEGWILIAPETGGWLSGDTSARGNFVFADSESLRPNVDIKERDAKITYGRGVKASTRTIGKVTPGGDVGFQFRSDDLPPVMLAHFQKFTGTYHGGTGSLGSTSRFVFVPEKGIPTFGGSSFGTGSYTSPKGNLFTVSVLKKYFDTTENGGTNAQWYKSCFVDQLAINCEADDDAKITASFMSGTLDAGTAIPSSANPNSILGSYSTKSVFNSWAATVTWAGGTLPVNSLSLTSQNASEEHMVLGNKNPIDYRFGKFRVEGNIDIDFPYDGLKYFKNLLDDTPIAVTATFYNSATDYMTVAMPNCRLMDLEAPLQPAEDTVTVGLPIKAYESEDGITPPITVTVHTNTYGSVPWVRA